MRRRLLALAAFFFLPFLPSWAWGATCDAVSTSGGNWNDATKWSSGSGGSPSTCAASSGVPGTSGNDTAILDGSSGGGTFSVNTNFNLGTGQLTAGAFTGTLSFGSSTPSMGIFSGTGAGVRTYAFGTSVITLTAAGTAWDFTTTTNLTASASAGALVDFTNSTASTKTWNSAAVNYGSLDVRFGGSGSGGFTLNGVGSTHRDTLITNTGGAGFLFSGGPTMRSLIFSNGYSGVWSGAGGASLSGDLTLISAQGTPTASGTLSFIGSSPQLITSAGKSLAIGITINGASASVSPADALVTSGIFTHTNGTFDTTGLGITTGSYASGGVLTRGLTLGASLWQITGTGTAWNVTNVTGYTVTPGTSKIKFTDASSTSKAFGGAGLTWYDLEFAGNGTGQFSISGASTSFHDVLVSGTGAATFTTSVALNARNLDHTGFTLGTWAGSGTWNLTGNLIVAAASNTANGAVTFSGSSPQTITSNGKAIASPITVNGASASLSPADALNTTGTLNLTQGTFDAANKDVTIGAYSSSNSNARTRTMGSGTWSLTGNWNEATSTNETVDVGTSTTKWTGSGTISIQAGSKAAGDFYTFDLSSFTGTWSAAGGSLNVAHDFKLCSACTLSNTNGVSFVGASGTQGVTSNGKTYGGSYTVNTGGATVKPQDTLSTSSSVTVSAGNFDGNGQAVNATFLQSTTASTRQVTCGSGTYSLSRTSGNVWNVTGSNYTVSCASAVIKFTGALVGNGDFTGAAQSYGTLWCATTGAFACRILDGGNTFAVLKADAGRSVTVASGTSNTVTAWTLQGSAGNAVTLAATSTTNYALVPTAAASLSYVSLSRATISPALVTCGTGCVDAGNTAGVIWANDGTPSNDHGSLTRFGLY